MIPVTPIEKVEEVCENYCNSIINYLSNPKFAKELESINKTISELFSLDRKIEDLIKSSQQELEKYVKKYNTLGLINKLKIHYVFYWFPKYYKRLTSDKTFYYNNFMVSHLAKRIVHDLNIKVCPYCNRNFIVDTVKGRSSELDHFYPVSKYPFLALSFYNLIPSCKPCNHNKKDNIDSIINPYDYRFHFGSVKFSFKNNGTTLKCEEKDIEIELITENMNEENILKSHDEVFSINELYQNHRDIVMELLQKNEIYQSNYIDSLFREYGPESGNCVFSSKNELMRLITGNFVEEENIGKRPLAKLNRDIAKELGFIDE